MSTPARDHNDLLIPDIFWHVTQRSSSRIAWRAKTAAVGGYEYTETRIEKLTLIDVHRCLRWLATKISTLPNTSWWMLPLVEVQNGTSKNVGVEKIFVLSRYRSVFYGSRRLEVSQSRFRLIYASQSLQFFADWSRSLGFVVFICPFGLRKSNFFRVNRYIGYPTNRLRKSETRQPAVYWWASASFHWRKRSFY